MKRIISCLALLLLVQCSSFAVGVITSSKNTVNPSGVPAQGDVLYHNGASWTRLSAGSSGEVLQTQGANANPKWGATAGTGDMLKATYDPASVNEQLVGLTIAQILTNKTINSGVIGGTTTINTTGVATFGGNSIVKIGDSADIANQSRTKLVVSNGNSTTVSNQNLAIFAEAKATTTEGTSTDGATACAFYAVTNNILNPNAVARGLQGGAVGAGALGSWGTPGETAEVVGVDASAYGYGYYLTPIFNAATWEGNCIGNRVNVIGGSATNTGIYINNQSPSGTNYGIYQVDTNKNYFGGQIGVGTGVDYTQGAKVIGSAGDSLLDISQTPNLGVQGQATTNGNTVLNGSAGGFFSANTNSTIASATGAVISANHWGSVAGTGEVIGADIITYASGVTGISTTFEGTSTGAKITTTGGNGTNYSLYMNNNSITGTNYGIYQADSKANYFGGQITTASTLSANSLAITGKGGVVSRVMTNGSTEAMVAGNVVILKVSDATGASVTMTQEASSSLVFGVVTVGGNAGATVIVAVNGFVSSCKVNGTTAINPGDYLSCYTTNGIAQKGSYSTGGVFGVALGAYSTADNNGTIPCWLK